MSHECYRHSASAPVKKPDAGWWGATRGRRGGGSSPASHSRPNRQGKGAGVESAVAGPDCAGYLWGREPVRFDLVSLVIGRRLRLWRCVGVSWAGCHQLGAEPVGVLEGLGRM